MTDNPVTLVYKRLAGTGLPIHLDIYPPTPAPLPSDPPSRLSAVVYFHGGGLTVGNRESWFPTWLHKRVTAAGSVFVSADYQLLPPATGRDIVRDISDLLAFLVEGEYERGSEGKDDVTRGKFTIDANAIAVAGSSAGGLCAYLAAMHCTSPRPCAVLSLYGMGGNFLTPHYLLSKTTPFFRGRDLLDPSDPAFAPFLHPACTVLPPVADVPLVYHGPEHAIPGYPAHPRMLLARLFLQLGVFLDHYTGTPGVSATLRDVLQENDTGEASEAEMEAKAERILAQSGALELFPQFAARAGKWPPTMLCHGTEDSAVPVGESRYLAGLLRNAGVKVEVLEFEGEEHSFDYAPGAEEQYGKEFDAVGKFLDRCFGKRGVDAGYLASV